MPRFGFLWSCWLLTRRAARRLTGIVYTPLCPLCQQPLHIETPHGVCVDCWPNLPFLPAHHCVACAYPLPVPVADDRINNNQANLCLACQQRPLAVDKIVAPFLYREPLISLILKLKYADDLALSRFFSYHLLAALKPSLGNPDDYLILPVPSHIKRTLKRKYNQAEVLARPLAALTNISLMTSLLIRTLPISQKNIGRDARWRQLKNAFALNSKITKRKKLQSKPHAGWEEIRHKKIILVDDVVTTCATMHHLAELLKKNGVKEVIGVAIARTQLGS